MFTTLFENLKKVNEEIDPSDIFKPWTNDEKNEMFVDNIKTQGCFQNDDGTWSSERDVNISERNLKVIPVQFKKVAGHFYCTHNQLTSLKGCPVYVGKNFGCSYNLLTSLEGCPEIVRWRFWCLHNAKQFTEAEVRKLCIVGEDIKVTFSS
jgi:hypothetical protein